MSKKDFVVALYDFRSKQKYIYRTNAVKEIMGASEILKNAYKNFIREYGKIKNDVSIKFNLANFENSNDDGEVLYDGGGNLQVIFKSKDKCIQFNKEFSKWLLDNTYSLSVVTSICEFEDNYEVCRKNLYKQNGINKAQFSPQMFSNVLPFTQIDRKTSQPISLKRKGESFSRESELKIDNYEKHISKSHDYKKYEKEFDNIVTAKGEESLLAVIYIDGNRLGDRIRKTINDQMNFEDGINAMRQFSKEIKEDFVDKPLKAINEKLRKLNNENQEGKKIKNFSIRKIIGGGDEITIVCNARIALDIVKIYFDSLNSENTDNKINSACAGISIFHSHDPFTVAYTIAEQCCESGKNRIKKLGDNAKDYCYIDYYFCHSGITGDVEELRIAQEKESTNLPYCYIGNDEEHLFTDYEKTKDKILKIGRSNVKALKEAAIKGDSYFEFEIERIKSKYNSFIIEPSLENKKMISDISTVYDIWFAESEV